VLALCIYAVSPAYAAQPTETASDACNSLNNLSGAAKSACQQGFNAQKGGTSKDNACTQAKYPDSGNLNACREGWDLAAGIDPATECNSDNCDFIAKYVNPAINVLTVSFGLIVVISLILGGIEFSASEGDPQKASRAKSRISNTILALLAYSLLYGFIQFLIPGGLF
jgi:hypothetical protein